MHAAASATSLGWPPRPSGEIAFSRSAIPGSCRFHAAIMSMSVVPEAIAFTRSPSRPYSCAAVVVRSITARLVAGYALRFGAPPQATDAAGVDDRPGVRIAQQRRDLRAHRQPDAFEVHAGELVEAFLGEVSEPTATTATDASVVKRPVESPVACGRVVHKCSGVGGRAGVAHTVLDLGAGAAQLSP